MPAPRRWSLGDYDIALLSTVAHTLSWYSGETSKHRAEPTRRHMTHVFAVCQVGLRFPAAAMFVTSRATRCRHYSLGSSDWRLTTTFTASLLTWLLTSSADDVNWRHSGQLVSLLLLVLLCSNWHPGTSRQWTHCPSRNLTATAGQL